jgi:type III restriction enzyme
VLKATEVDVTKISAHSAAKYDLIGKLAKVKVLARCTIVDILKSVSAVVFSLYRTNQESFIAKATQVFNERLAYDTVKEAFDLDIITADLTNV